MTKASQERISWKHKTHKGKSEKPENKKNRKRRKKTNKGWTRIKE